jgi:phenylalanyl-tRNA synthetase beta chain
MMGLEVESIDRPGDKYARFVVGTVLDVAKHPNADKLSVCRVDVGEETLQIVCGAPNVAAGQRVAVGLAGAVVPKNQHDPNGKPFVLTHVKVRGQDSYGMICSAYELDLGDDKNGIMLLDASARVGMPLGSYLGLDDTVMEIGITPNRPDAMSHVGIAREVGAILSRKISLPKASLKESSRPVKKHLAVRIENPVDCPRYSARVIMGTRVVESPEWLKKALLAIDLRPINAIVDVTNYVLMEIGQPLHAFDYDRVTGHEIVVRSAAGGEKFVTLDGKERTMRDDSLMICDARGSVAVAGVMGGMNSEISDSTVNIIIESAYFRPQSVRRTSKHLGLSSDASQRFERGADPNITLWALDRAASLIQEIAGGEVLRGVIDVYPKKIKPREIDLRIEKVNEILGISVDAKRVTSLLRKIDLVPAAAARKAKSPKTLRIQVPTFRPDIEREIDLIEEVARLYGYNNIETTAKSFTGTETVPSADRCVEITRKWLLGSGYSEVVANSMAEPSVARLASGRVVEIANPISKEMGALRTSLVPGMLGIMRNNIAHGNKDLRLYEFGTSYLTADGSERGKYLERYVEKEQLLLAYAGTALPHAWDVKTRPVDLFDVRGELETLFQKIFLDKINFIPYSNGNTLTRTGLAVEIQGESAGSLGAVRKEIREKFDLDSEIFVAVLDLDVVRRHMPLDRRYVPLPRYPSVHRDVAFVVDKDVPIGSLEACIRESVAGLALRVELFDVYVGNQIPSEKKSCAFSLEFLSRDHTLTQVEIDQVMQSVIGNVSKSFHASIRA